MPAAPPDVAYSTADHVIAFPDRPYVLDTGRLEALGLVADRPPLETTITAAYDHLLSHPERRTWAPHPKEIAAREQLGL